MHRTPRDARTSGRDGVGVRVVARLKDVVPVVVLLSGAVVSAGCSGAGGAGASAEKSRVADSATVAMSAPESASAAAVALVKKPEKLAASLPRRIDQLTKAQWASHLDALGFNPDWVLGNRRDDMEGEKADGSDCRASITIIPTEGAERISLNSYNDRGYVIARLENLSDVCIPKHYKIPPQTVAWWTVTKDVAGYHSRFYRTDDATGLPVKLDSDDMSFESCGQSQAHKRAEAKFTETCPNGKAIKAFVTHIPAWITCPEGCCYAGDT